MKRIREHIPCRADLPFGQKYSNVGSNADTNQIGRVFSGDQTMKGSSKSSAQLTQVTFLSATGASAQILSMSHKKSKWKSRVQGPLKVQPL